MIKIGNKPRDIRVPGAQAFVLRLHPGGIIQVRQARKRLWYVTTVSAVWFQAARVHAAHVIASRRSARRANRG